MLTPVLPLGKRLEIDMEENRADAPIASCSNDSEYKSWCK